MALLGLVHTGDKIDFDSVDFVEVDWIDQTVDEIDQVEHVQLWSIQSTVQSTESTVRSILSPVCTERSTETATYFWTDYVRDGIYWVICVLYSRIYVYRVGQIKWHHFTVLLVTNECINKILWFLAQINYIKQQIAWCQFYVNEWVTR